jgi:hypothetical protein
MSQEGLPRDSNALEDWALHCYVDPEADAIAADERARRLRIARTALAGIEELLANGEITDVTLTFALPGIEDDPGTEFTFSAEGRDG